MSKNFTFVCFGPSPFSTFYSNLRSLRTIQSCQIEKFRLSIFKLATSVSLQFVTAHSLLALKEFVVV